jgi:hypothetical protein
MTYISDLYRAERYGPGMLSTYFNEWAIQYERSRIFYTFLTPLKIKCTEEILLYNSGHPVNHIIHDLVEFKEQLYIYDSNDRKLEFHSFYGLNCQNDYLIKIEFPQDRIFNTGEYRTVILQYFIEYPTFAGNFARLDVSLNFADITYITLEKPKEYQTTLWLFKDHDGALEFLPSEGMPDNELLLIEESDVKLQIIGVNTPENKDLAIIISHDLHNEQKMWFTSGILFGWISSVFILSEFLTVLPRLQDHSKFLNYVPSIVPLGVAAITSLLIIKGWMFTKDMDSTLNDIYHKNGIYFTYSRVYIALISILILELGATLSICSISALR